MRKASLIAGILFLGLTFAGGIYVIASGGEANPGYAVIPSLAAIICFGYYRRHAHAANHGSERKKRPPE